MSTARVQRLLKEKAARKAAKRDPRSRVKPTTCPGCGYKNDAATFAFGESGEDARPTPGSFVVCLNCGQIMVFDEECEPVLVLPDELEALKTESPDFHQKLLQIANTIKEMAATGLPIKDREVPKFKPIRTICRVDWGHIPGQGEGPYIKAEGPAAVGFSTLVLCKAIAQMKDDYPEEVREAALKMVEVLNPKHAKEPEIEIYKGKGGVV